MKLHFNADATSQGSIRKLRSVFAAAEVKVEEVEHKTGDDVSKISFFNTLPLLETPEGTIFSSNTIARYVASTHKNALYGGDNQHHQALVDQWLDITACDFEPATRTILRQVQGEKVDFAKLMEDVNKFLTYVEKQLAEKKFLVGDSLSIADLSLASSVSVVFSTLFGEGQRKKYPNTLNWYTAIATGTPEVGPADLPKETHEAFKGGKKQGKKEEKPAKEDKKTEAKPAAEEDDLFGDDSAPAPAPQPKKEPKKEPKKKPAAKSIVVFDVKVYEQETDLNKLFEKVKQIEVEGLVWNAEPKIVPVAFGMNKLQVGCVVEDDKVSMDELFEKIEEWEEVQSTDTVSFQKL